MDYAFDYVKDHGITTEERYPYRAEDEKCRPAEDDFQIAGHNDVPQGDVDQLAKAVAQQPVSIAVDAQNFQFYAGGVFDNCGDQLDHGVLLVGYTPEAWIIKNSWGPEWGEKGFIRVKRGNTCGIANAASYPYL